MGPTILARERELEATTRFLDAIAAAPAALVFTGLAGIGKTTLWQCAAEGAARRGFRVLSTRSTEAEAHLSYAALTDLVGASFDETRGSLPPAQESALAAALLRGPPEDTAAARVIATAFTGVLEALAEDAPLVVAVDDVQWLDAASRRALEFAVRRLTPRIGILVAERTDAAGDALGLRRALPEERVELAVVGPLSMAALHHLIADRLGTPLRRPVLGRIAEASGGNPFFALELARAAPAGWEPLSLPPSLRDLVASRIGGLSGTARDAVLVAAALARPTVTLVSRILGSEADAALDEAEGAGVLEDVDGRLRFSHPLLAAGLDGFATPAERRRLHRRLADVVDVPEERARHLALSAVEPDEQVAAEIEAAADDVAQRGAQDGAAELYAAAAKLTPPERPTEFARRLLGEASALFAVGDADAAAALAERAASAPDRLIRARALLLHAEIVWAAGATENVIAELDGALEAARGQRVLEARVRSRIAAFATAVVPERAVAEARAVQRLLRAASEPDLLAYALFNGFLTDALLGRGARRDDLERGLELEARAGAQAAMSSIPLIWFHFVDDHEAARARHAHEDRWYEERGEEFWRAERLAHRAIVELRAGELDLAERFADESWSRTEPFRESAGWVAPHVSRGLIDAHRGRFERARADLTAHIARMEATGNLWWAALSLSTLAFVEFAAGHHEAADEALVRMRAATDAIGFTDVLPDRSEPNEIESWLTRGEVERAREALARLEWRESVLPRPWIAATLPRARALFLAAAGDMDAALAIIDAAPRIPQLPFEAARTELVRGRLHRRANHRRLAAEALGGALAEFERLGAVPWIAQAKDELDRVGLRRRAPDELTAGERKVAELAASGLTNREVAEAAFMSPKTVEANLARVYRKLGIRSRAELGARLAVEQREPGAQT